MWRCPTPTARRPLTLRPAQDEVGRAQDGGDGPQAPLLRLPRPLNIASFLMGTTEFLIAMKTEPDKVKLLLEKVTSFLLAWQTPQRATFPSIDGIMVLDDIVGFIGRDDFIEFAEPYLARLYAPAASVKLFHNDADCAVSVDRYPGISINLYNPRIQLSRAWRSSSGPKAKWPSSAPSLRATSSPPFRLRKWPQPSAPRRLPSPAAPGSLGPARAGCLPKSPPRISTPSSALSEAEPGLDDMQR